MENFDLIISIVNRGHSDLVVEATREAGASGGTILYGRGTSIFERDSFMGVSILPEKEVVMTISPSDNKNNIIENICNKTNIDSAGLGICFTLPVTQVRGLGSKYHSKNKEDINKIEKSNNEVITTSIQNTTPLKSTTETKNTTSNKKNTNSQSTTTKK